MQVTKSSCSERSRFFRRFLKSALLTSASRCSSSLIFSLYILIEEPSSLVALARITLIGGSSNNVKGRPWIETKSLHAWSVSDLKKPPIFCCFSSGRDDTVRSAGRFLLWACCSSLSFPSVFSNSAYSLLCFLLRWSFKCVVAFWKLW